MTSAMQLRLEGVKTFPCWVKRDGGRWRKGPTTPKGVSWQDVATWPYDTPGLDWSSGVFGVPIPAGVLVIDVDTYKGATLASIEAALGVPLPWAEAHVQTTISGGHHFAFAVDWDVVQGDSLLNTAGFDTRCAGRGFICSGTGYTPVQFGLMSFAHPQVLPRFPDECRALLERVERAPKPTGEYQEGAGADTDKVVAALRHIDPGCSRREWFRTGMAIKDYYQHDEVAGEAIFDHWSRGDFWHGGCPDNYVPEDVPAQYATFKVGAGGVTASTLFYKAMQHGWQPPATFDAARAFGPGAAAADVFAELVNRVRVEACDIAAVPALLESIRQAGCNALQVALLASEVKQELSAAGTKDKAVTAHIDALLSTQPTHTDAPLAPGVYGKNDSDNALTFLNRYYPNGTLLRSDSEHYAFTGKVWRRLPRDEISHLVSADMAAQRQNSSRMEACARVVKQIVPLRESILECAPPHLIAFSNGTLDLTTGLLGSHDPAHYLVHLLPFDWAPGAACPAWQTFLNDVFDGDRQCVELLQEWFGYLLTKDYRHQKMLILLGPPRCGKGTIGRVLHALVGDANFSGGELSSFAKDSYLDGLRTKSAVFIGDAEKKVSPMIINQVIGRIKAVSGNDAVSFHRMYVGPISCTLPARIMIGANSLPNLFDDSGALGSRMMLLPFCNSYLDREDLGLGARLIHEIEGIAAWALEGLRRLNANGRFTRPDVSLNEIALIQEAYSPVSRFVTDCCVVAQGARVSSVDVYNAYRAWSLAEGEDILRQKSFVSSLRDSLRGARVSYGTQRPVGVPPFRGFSGLGIGQAVASGAASAFQPRIV